MSALTETTSSSSPKLNIMYWNVHGLKRNIWRWALNQIHSRSFDIIFLSETWFLDDAECRRHHFFLCQTIKPGLPGNGHRPGGILAMAHPDLHNQIALIAAGSHRIDLCVLGVVVRAVYFPPNLMSSSSMYQEMIAEPHPAITIGDFNTNVKPSNGDPTHARQIRSRRFREASALLGARRVPPVGYFSRTDHVIAATYFARTFNLTIPPIPDSLRSDHRPMYLSCPLRFFLPPQPALPPASAALLQPRRPNMHRLRSRGVPEYMCARYDRDEMGLSDLLSSLTSATPSAGLHPMIDLAASLLTEWITLVAFEACGSYNVAEAKATTHATSSFSSSSLTSPASSADAIRLFKRSMRGQQKRVHSSDPSLTPIQQATDLFRSVFQSDRSVNLTDYQVQSLDPALLASLVDVEDIANIIRQYPSTKSPGPDGISISILQALLRSSLFLPHISSFFAICFRFQYTPLSWNVSLVHLLPKNPTGIVFVPDTRPIALTPILRRLFESRFLNHATGFSWAYLHKFQAGFRQGHCAPLQALVANECKRSGLPFTAFLDFAHAFDSVPHDLLLERLRLRGCTWELPLILSLIARDSRTIVQVNEDYTLPLTKTCGVPQGSLLSPLLFACYIDSLASDLESAARSFALTNHLPCATLYADDVALHASNISDLQVLLTVAADWAIVNKLKFRISKCGIVAPSASKWLLGSQQVPIVPEYKYLGLWTGRNGILWLKTVLARSVKSATLSAKVALSTGTWSFYARLAVYKTFVRPIAEYGAMEAFLWATAAPSSRSGVIDTLSSAHMAGLQLVFQTTLHPGILEFLSALGPWQRRYEELAALTYLRIQKFDPDHPIRVLLDSLDPMTSSSSVLRRLAIPNDIANRWRRFKSDNREAVLATWLRSDRLTSMTGLTDQSKHITDDSRTRSSKIDKVLAHPDGETRSLAFQWRIGTLWLLKTCTCCNRTFSRLCVLQCKLLTTHSDLVTAPIHQRVFSEWIGWSTTATDTAIPGHTALDHLLNSGQFEEFVAALEIILTRLRPTYPSIDIDIDIDCLRAQ